MQIEPARSKKPTTVSEVVAKLAWLGAATKTVLLYGKAQQQRHGNFATISMTIKAANTRLC
jgi:hypothetical protein